MRGFAARSSAIDPPQRVSVGIVRFMGGGDHRAVRARPAGVARLRAAIGSGDGETSLWTPLAACVAALLIIVASVAIALLGSGQRTADNHGAVAETTASARAGTSAATPAASPRPRASAVPSPSRATPEPTAPTRAASPTASRTSPSPQATSSPPHCPPGLAKHHRC